MNSTTLTDVKPLLTTTTPPSKAFEPQQDFQRVWPRPAIHSPIRCPNGSAFSEELDLNTRHYPFSFLREPRVIMRRMPRETTGGMSSPKVDTTSCMTALTSLFACLPTPAQPTAPLPPKIVEMDLMKPLPDLPAELIRQRPAPLLRRPHPTTFRNISYVALSSLGQEDLYRDIQRRARRVRLGHVSGGLADEYFLPKGARAHTAPAR